MTSASDPVETAAREAAAEGLAGVVAARTRLSHVQGDAGRLIIAGYEVGEIAPVLPFESMVHLLMHDRLPDTPECQALAAAIGRARALGRASLAMLAEAARCSASPMDALRAGVAGLALEEVTAERLLGAMPSLVATYHRLLAGEKPIGFLPNVSQAEAFLLQLRGSPAEPRAARALTTYWNTVSDHGLNASTFTARVIASTGGSLGSAIEGALGALAGPLHGGAPGPALENFLRLRAQSSGIAELEASTRSWAAAEIRAGRRLMGFGHRVYRVRDPRADVLARAAESLLEGSDLLPLARAHESAVLEVLQQEKPGRRIATNVEFYTALLLHGLGFQPAWFTPIFALGRVAGWVAHYAEQRRANKLIRPDALYVGAEGRSLSPPRS
jgi:citrate synthase